MNTHNWTIFGAVVTVCGVAVGIISLGVGIAALLIGLTPLELRWNDSSDSTARTANEVSDAADSDGADRDTNGAPAAATDPSAQQQEESGQQEQQQAEDENKPPPPDPPPPDPPDLDGIAGGARICASPECPEQYVVKIVGDQRFKRLLLSYAVVTFYGQFDNTQPLRVPQDALDAFETSCFVWFNDGSRRTYYHFDARPGTDDGVKRRINATESDLRNTGIASAAFEVNERELTYFADRGSVTLTEAMHLPCIG